MTINFPLCNKCCNAIIEWKETDFGRCGILTGCKECVKIKSFEDAKSLCPLLGKEGKSAKSV